MTVPKYLVLEKLVGQTPLEAINAWRCAHPDYRDVAATYAGRLDPMASGKLLVLLGPECRKRTQYTNLDKEYEIEVVLGFSTDTGDALGLPKIGSPAPYLTQNLMHSALRSVTGTHTVPYPAFSSRTVRGKPLFQYALEGSLDTIKVPKHKETIYDAFVLEQKALTAEELGDRIREHLRSVPRSEEPSKQLGADFRQDEIRDAWDQQLASVLPEETFTVLSLRVICTSGTYMRTLAERLARALGTSGFALTINRTQIGRYRKFGPFSFWTKRY